MRQKYFKIKNFPIEKDKTGISEGYEKI